MPKAGLAPRRPPRQHDWESSFQPRPAADAVRALLASEGVYACRKRWGGSWPSHLIRTEAARKA